MCGTGAERSKQNRSQTHENTQECPRAPSGSEDLVECSRFVHHQNTKFTMAFRSERKAALISRSGRVALAVTLLRFGINTRDDAGSYAVTLDCRHLNLNTFVRHNVARLWRSLQE